MQYIFNQYRGKAMKIMSFNTQHCSSYIEKKIDFRIIANTITGLGADVVGLNEMRGAGTDSGYTAQTETLSALTGMEYYYFAEAIRVGGENPYGNAILSRVPIKKVETVAIPDPEPKRYNGYYESRCVLKAELENGLTVLVTHMGLNPDEQENAVKTVLPLIKDEKCVLMGDFNVLPSDSVLAPIRAKMRDTAELFDREKLSFPSDVPDRKIDYIFVSPDLILTEADIPAVVASDHRPHTAAIEI